MIEDKLLAWHFLREDRRLQFAPHTFVEAGQTLSAVGPLVLCNNGMHASKRPMDALSYAPGPIVCRVELRREITADTDKHVARERHVIWMADASTVLHEFACWCAEHALMREREAGREPDARCWAAIEAKRVWLRGEITDEQLSAASAAARAAAWDAARAAACAAARAAACAAARDAARAAVWAAVWDAACAADWDAARAAARDAQNTELERRLLALAPVGVEAVG